MKARGLLVAGALEHFQPTAFRIGHMGDIRPPDVERTLDALRDVLGGDELIPGSSIGLAAGVAIGAAARSVPALAAGVEWLEPAGTIFIRSFTMVVLPLVIASLFVGVTSLGDIRRLGRIGGRTLAYFLITTVLAAIIGTAVALVARVGTGLDPAVRDSIAGRFNTPGSQPPAVSTVPTFVQTIVAMVPQNPIAAAAQGDLLAVIFTVIVFGAAATTMSEEKTAATGVAGRGRERRVAGRDRVRCVWRR